MDINSWKYTWDTIPWQNAPENEIIQKIKDFYNAGVDFNMTGDFSSRAPLDYAAEYSTVKVMDLLIDGGANINSSNKIGTALIWAARGGKIENVKYLIERGPKDFVNRKAKNGWTPLHFAAGFGFAETTDLLIKNGADVNAQTEDGDTPLHWAAKNNYPDCIKLLIENGADKNLKNKHGWTALFDATYGGSAETIKLLIDFGSDVNSKDNQGKIPLYWATIHGNPDAVKALLEAGTDVNIRDNNGKTVFDVVEGSTFFVKKYIENAVQIRADYLKNHLAQQQTNLSLIRNQKTR